MDKDEKQSTSSTKVLVIDTSLQIDDASCQLLIEFILREQWQGAKWPRCVATPLVEGVLTFYTFKERTSHDEEAERMKRLLNVCRDTGLVEPRIFSITQGYTWTDRNFTDGILPTLDTTTNPATLTQIMVCYQFKETLQRSRRGSRGAPIVDSLEAALAKHQAVLQIVLQPLFDPLARRSKGQAVPRTSHKATLLDLTQDAFRLKDWLPRASTIAPWLLSHMESKWRYERLEDWLVLRESSINNLARNEFHTLMTYGKDALTPPPLRVQVVEVGLACESNPDHACLFFLSGLADGGEQAPALMSRALGCLHQEVKGLGQGEHKPLSSLPPSDVVFVVSANEQLLASATAAWRAQRQRADRYPLIIDYNAAAGAMFAQKRGSEGGWFTRDRPREDVELADLCQMALMLANSIALPFESIFTLGRLEIASYLMEGVFEAARLVPLHVPLQSFFKKSQFPSVEGSLKRSAEAAMAEAAPVSSYRGGRVLSAGLGLYATTIEIDFDSQYPSIMAERGIFYSCQFQEDARFSSFLRRWIKQKRSFKELKQTALAAAAKLKNNVMYGCLGQSNTLIGSQSLAAQVTEAGRAYLEEAVALAQADKTTRVLMGHTDALLLTSYKEETIKQICQRFPLETVDGPRDESLTDVTLRAVNRYDFTWVISKTRHFSILTHKEGWNILDDLIPQLFAPWEEEGSQVRNRLNLAVAVAKNYAVFPGLLNKSMPPAVQFLTLLAHFIVAAAWRDKDHALVLDSEQRKPWTTELREEHLPALLQHVPDWIHWIANPHALLVPRNQSASAPLATQNDSNYRQWIVRQTLELSGGQPTGAGYLPVFRNTKTGQFERMGTSFDMDAIDQQWWLHRLLHTMQTQLARTPGVDARFLDGVLLALKEAFGIDEAFKPVTHTIRLRASGESDESNPSDESDPLKVEAQGVWSEFRARQDSHIPVPDAGELAAFLFGKMSARDIDPATELSEEAGQDDLEMRLTNWWQVQLVPLLQTASEACQPLLLEAAMDDLLNRFDWQSALAHATSSAPAFARAMAEPRAQHLREQYRRATATIMTLFRILNAADGDKMETD
jgi:hypothetical protein